MDTRAVAGAGTGAGAGAGPDEARDGRACMAVPDDESVALRRFRTPTEITDRILLGSHAHSLNKRVLLELGVTHVLNVHTSHRFRDTPFETLHVPLSDFGDDDLGGGVLDTCFAFMDKAHAPNATGCHDKRVLVHCSKGVNRSPTVVIAYLMRRLGWSLKKAYLHVTKERPVASPHERYFEQLQALELQWAGIQAPTLTREDIGPSLQQMLRDIAASHRTHSELGCNSQAASEGSSDPPRGEPTGPRVDRTSPHQSAAPAPGDGLPAVAGIAFKAQRRPVVPIAVTQLSADTARGTPSTPVGLPSSNIFAAALLRGAQQSN